MAHESDYQPGSMDISAHVKAYGELLARTQGIDLQVVGGVGVSGGSGKQDQTVAEAGATTARLTTTPGPAVASTWAE